MHGLVGVWVDCMVLFKYSWGLDLTIKTIKVARSGSGMFQSRHPLIIV